MLKSPNSHDDDNEATATTTRTKSQFPDISITMLAVYIFPRAHNLLKALTYITFVYTNKRENNLLSVILFSSELVAVAFSTSDTVGKDMLGKENPLALKIRMGNRTNI